MRGKRGNGNHRHVWNSNRPHRRLHHHRLVAVPRIKKIETFALLKKFPGIMKKGRIGSHHPTTNETNPIAFARIIISTKNGKTRVITETTKLINNSHKMIFDEGAKNGSHQGIALIRTVICETTIKIGNRRIINNVTSPDGSNRNSRERTIIITNSLVISNHVTFEMRIIINLIGHHPLNSKEIIMFLVIVVMSLKIFEVTKTKEIGIQISSSTIMMRLLLGNLSLTTTKTGHLHLRGIINSSASIIETFETKSQIGSSRVAR
mmetsp:Transcript_26342/g.39903  ORF Transcript_26342/g.39903 Transcript_26342/m.39903 type:complete len:263 (+) Transcript_26342:797-1585(+)